MNEYKANLPGVVVFEPDVFSDKRGYFKEIFNCERYEASGIRQNFVQDNFSSSRRGVLRGLHFQKVRPQGKLVTCLRGSIFDVVVDINPNSKTFKNYFSVELNDKNHLQLWIPPGYAHGFCVLSEQADFMYKCTELYEPNDESGICWNDESIGINWPIERPIISDKDQQLPTLLNMLENRDCK